MVVTSFRVTERLCGKEFNFTQDCEVNSCILPTDCVVNNCILLTDCVVKSHILPKIVQCAVNS